MLPAYAACGISIHALLAESDKLIPGAQRQPPISIHALLAESDPRSAGPWQAGCRISIHALLAESDGVTVLGIQHRVGISIHALLAESDWGLMGGSNCDGNFYPRSPCGERRGGHISQTKS